MTGFDRRALLTSASVFAGPRASRLRAARRRQVHAFGFMMKTYGCAHLIGAAMLLALMAPARAESAQEHVVESGGNTSSDTLLLAAPPPDPPQVVWNSPSVDASGSMPLGNGDLGANVWVERNGDLVLWLSKTDAWDENSRLVKIGKVRVTFTPPLPADGTQEGEFRQVLDPARGMIIVSAGKTNIEIWIDAHEPVIHIDVSGPAQEATLVADIRRHDRELSGVERDGAYGISGGDFPIVSRADRTHSWEDETLIGWFHANQPLHDNRSVWALTLELQGLGQFADEQRDPLARRVFGAAIQGDGMVRTGELALRSTSATTRRSLRIGMLTRPDATVDEWANGIEQVMRRAAAADPATARDAHVKYWADYCRRSYIQVSATSPQEQAGAQAVTQGYALQRFINACAGRGPYPIKFNGSVFNVGWTAPAETFDADYRRWGGAYWFQNTRLPYWSMLASGDDDLLQPLFKMYLAALPLAQQRTKVYYDHDGGFFPETMYFWGTYTNDNYGWDRDGKSVDHVDNRYIRNYWQSGLELSWLMLEYFSHTRNVGFARSTLLPVADAIVTFYDEHYPRDPQGKLLITHTNALETYADATNPLPDVAGLRVVLPGLLELPHDLTNDRQRARWRRFLQELPPLPTKQIAGQPALAPAAQYGDPLNTENPELYAVFPYRLYGVGKPDLELARRTFAHRVTKGTGGWSQDAVQAALLGLTQQAKQDVVRNFSTHFPGARFPAFWGPNADWIPDQDHGGIAMIALQRMLVQSDGRTIHLLPAWPREWNVRFKLRVAGGGAVQAEYAAGVVNVVADPSLAGHNFVVSPDLTLKSVPAAARQQNPQRAPILGP